MIRTLGLACAYAGAQPLRFPDVDLPQGGRLLVQGRSGSGKSTWLSLVAGLKPGTAVQFQVQRADRQLQLAVTPTKRPRQLSRR